VAINDKAEFTPRVALTEEERADLLFGVKVELADTTGVLKPGLPATVTFSGVGIGDSGFETSRRRRSASP
jgi:HlyD family secretion protein